MYMLTPSPPEMSLQDVVLSSLKKPKLKPATRELSYTSDLSGNESDASSGEWETSKAANKKPRRLTQELRWKWREGRQSRQNGYLFGDSDSEPELKNTSRVSLKKQDSCPRATECISQATSSKAVSRYDCDLKGKSTVYDVTAAKKIQSELAQHFEQTIILVSSDSETQVYGKKASAVSVKKIKSEPCDSQKTWRRIVVPSSDSDSDVDELKLQAATPDGKCESDFETAEDTPCPTVNDSKCSGNSKLKIKKPKPERAWRRIVVPTNDSDSETSESKSQPSSPDCESDFHTPKEMSEEEPQFQFKPDPKPKIEPKVGRKLESRYTESDSEPECGQESVIVLSSDEEKENAQPDNHNQYILGVRTTSESETDYLPPWNPKHQPVPRKVDPKPVCPIPFLEDQPGKRTFLASLSPSVPDTKRHLQAAPYIQQFRKNRESLTRILFMMFNKNVFNSQLPHDMQVVWNKRLTKTAGLCRMRQRVAPGGQYERICAIDLSEKVLDSASRLRDTLIHEMCHAAVWIIDRSKDDRHGPLWKRWGRSAQHAFPELPPVARCHSYQIQYKFHYRCGFCQWKTGRHSKPAKAVICKWCKRVMAVSYSPTPGGARGQAVTPKTPRTPNIFATFVKDNYASTRHEGASHSEVMKLLSKKFAETKLII